ncbi:MAG: hypothetical protein RLP44_01630 [Aggregatilineales bacterium]
MTAQFKSNVRIREEKGLGSVSMKRMIFCGVGAVLTFMVLRLTPLTSISLPALVIVFVLLLIFSGSRGGLPLWKRLMLAVRGLLVIEASHSQLVATQLAELLSMDTSIAHLKSDNLFGRHTRRNDAGEGDWTLYNDLGEAEAHTGLQFVDRGVLRGD